MQALLYGGFVILLIRGGSEAVRESEKDMFNLVSRTLSWSIEAELDVVRSLTSALSHDKQVSELFASGDRKGLLDYVMSVYEANKLRVSRFHFHRPDGTSFLRVHKEEEGHDQLAEIRPMIRAVHEEREPVSGIETGKSGPAIRAISPVFHNGTYIGAFEAGIAMDNVFMNHMRDKFSADFCLFLLDEDNTPYYQAGNWCAGGCLPAGDDLARLVSGKPVWSTECNSGLPVALYPFRDYTGRVSGVIKAELRIIPLADSFLQLRSRLGLLGVLLFLVLSLTLSLSMTILLRPLRMVVDETRMISARIIRGDLEFRGRVETLSPEFRDIIYTVNEIISALRDRQGILQAIVEGLPGFVFYVDIRPRVLWANRRTMDRFPSLVGSDPSLVQDSFFSSEEAVLSSSFFSGSVITVERESSGRWWEHAAVPVRSEAGLVTHVIRISTDITHRKETEQRLLELNDNLEHRVNREVEKRKEGERIAEQQSRLASIGELATGMAHEITQPLNAISFSVENIQNRYHSGALDSDYLQKKIKSIDSDIDRVRRVIDHVRLFARSTPDEYSVAFDVNRSVENALAMLGVQLSSHGIEIVFEQAAGGIALCGNPYQFEQVVINLLSNARDAIEERLIDDSEKNLADSVPGRICVETRLDGPFVVLEVRDNGTGIAEECRRRALDPFFTTKKEGKGTGLGLSISFGIIRKMAGDIYLENIPDSMGTCVSVRVPLYLGEKESCSDE